MEERLRLAARLGVSVAVAPETSPRVAVEQVIVEHVSALVDAIRAFSITPGLLGSLRRAQYAISQLR